MHQGTRHATHGIGHHWCAHRDSRSRTQYVHDHLLSAGQGVLDRCDQAPARLREGVAALAGPDTNLDIDRQAPQRCDDNTDHRGQENHLRHFFLACKKARRLCRVAAALSPAGSLCKTASSAFTAWHSGHAQCGQGCRRASRRGRISASTMATSTSVCSLRAALRVRTMGGGAAVKASTTTLPGNFHNLP